MFRAKCRWVENGERPTKYFFNMEKRNYNKKTINELRLPDESTSRDEKQILDQIETKIKKLYTSEELFLRKNTTNLFKVWRSKGSPMKIAII